MIVAEPSKTRTRDSRANLKVMLNYHRKLRNRAQGKACDLRDRTEWCIRCPVSMTQKEAVPSAVTKKPFCGPGRRDGHMQHMLGTMRMFIVS